MLLEIFTNKILTILEQTIKDIGHKKSLPLLKGFLNLYFIKTEKPVYGNKEFHLLFHNIADDTLRQAKI